MFGSVRRPLGLVAVVILASAGFVAGASTPAPAADVTGYTIEARPLDDSGQCRLATVDLTTGEVAGVGAFTDDVLACASDLAFAPGGGLFGIVTVYEELEDPPDGEEATPTTDASPVEPQQPGSTVHLVRFDPASGAVSDVGQIGTADAWAGTDGGVTFDANGNLFVYMVGLDPECDDDAYCLYQVDPVNPSAATFLGKDPAETYLSGLTASCALGIFTVERNEVDDEALEPTAVVDSFVGGNQLDRVSATPPASATAVGGPFGAGQTVQSLDFGSDGTLWALGSLMPNGIPAGPARLSTLDPVTGVQTLGPSLSSESETIVLGLAVSAPSCPSEPVEIQPSFTG